jgi:hypothetical protein
MQKNGCKREAAKTWLFLVGDVESNTMERSIMMAENPKRQSLIHHDKPNAVATATPKKLKGSQKPQLKNDRPVIRLKSYIESHLKINMLTILSAIKLAKNRDKPKDKPLTSPS